MVNIRNMCENDYEAADQLMQQLHKLHVEGRPDLYIDIEHPYTKEEFMKKVNDPEIISIVAEKNKQVVGLCFCAMRNRSNMVNMRSAYMDDLFVCAEERRNGIAANLFAAAEKKAKELGAERLDLMVWGFNEPAIKFYKSLGMAEQRYILEKKI